MEHRTNLLIAVLFSSIVLCCMSSCSSSSGRSVSSEAAESILEEATRSVNAHNYDAAMEKALQALALSQDDPLLKVRSLHAIVGIDIMASRDDDAWESPGGRIHRPQTRIQERTLGHPYFKGQTLLLCRDFAPDRTQ